MSYDGNDATKAWALTPEQEQAVREFTGDTHSLSDMIKAFGIENGKIRLMPEAGWNALVDVPQAAPAAGSEIKTVKIDGKVVEGTQEFIDNAMKIAFAQHQQQQNDEPARDRNGRYTAEPAKDAKLSDAEAQKAADRAMLDLKFKRGEIDTVAYLEQSGAMRDYLQNNLGIDVNAHQSQAKSDAAYIQSWEDASVTFKQNAGSDWPGDAPGGPLQTALTNKMQELYGDLDPQDKVAALSKAWNALKLEAAMSKENNPQEFARLQEEYRLFVHGRSGQPDYRR